MNSLMNYLLQNCTEVEKDFFVRELENEITEYVIEDGEVFSRHRCTGLGCFFTEWELAGYTS